MTALLAVIGATPNARRAALAHIVFNVLTGIVALLLLPWLIDLLVHAREAMGSPPDPATHLALFHTIFNLIGVLLMWPLAGRLTHWLQQRFRAREENEAQPRFVDASILAVPTLALDALEREVARAGHVTVRMARSVLDGADMAALKADNMILASLDTAIERFVERLRSASMSHVASARLAELLGIQRYLEASAEQSLIAAKLPPISSTDERLEAATVAFCDAVHALLLECDPDGSTGVARIDTCSSEMETRYEGLKASLLASGAEGRLPLTEMEKALRRGSALRRAAQQLHKSRRRHLDMAPAATPYGPASGQWCNDKVGGPGTIMP